MANQWKWSYRWIIIIPHQCCFTMSWKKCKYLCPDGDDDQGSRGLWCNQRSENHPALRSVRQKGRRRRKWPSVPQESRSYKRNISESRDRNQELGLCNLLSGLMQYHTGWRERGWEEWEITHSDFITKSENSESQQVFKNVFLHVGLKSSEKGSKVLNRTKLK